MKNLTIIESKWAKGKPNHLLNKNGKYCAMGFLYSSLGFSDESILDRNFYPENIFDPDHKNKYPCIDFICQILGVNDDSKITDQERKNKLISIFKDFDYQLEFK